LSARQVVLTSGLACFLRGARGGSALGQGPPLPLFLSEFCEPAAFRAAGARLLFLSEFCKPAAFRAAGAWFLFFSEFCKPAAFRAASASPFFWHLSANLPRSELLQLLTFLASVCKPAAFQAASASHFFRHLSANLPRSSLFHFSFNSFFKRLPEQEGPYLIVHCVAYIMVHIFGYLTVSFPILAK